MIRLASLQAPNMHPFYEELCRVMQEKTGLKLKFETEGSWKDNQQALYNGEIQFGIICGLHYAINLMQEASLKLVVASVPVFPKEINRPVYYSHVFVRPEHTGKALVDLAQLRWGYNEPTSHSGFNLLVHEFLRLGLQPKIDQWTETGSHQRTLRALCEGRIDAGLVDETVWSLERAKEPILAKHLTSVQTLGPSTSPPLVAHRSVSRELVQTVRLFFEELHQTPEGIELLRTVGYQKFLPVVPTDYLHIAQMYGHTLRKQG